MLYLAGVPTLARAGRKPGAVWYVTNQDTHVKAIEIEGVAAFYVISSSNAGGTKQLTKKHIEMLRRAMLGELDNRIKDLASLIEVCQSVHVVCSGCTRGACP